MNHTRHIEFILLWLTDNSPLQIVVFVFLLLNYMLNATGDLIIIVLTLLESHLKTPMYISLHNFSFLEISFTSSCTPRFPITTVTRENMISYIGCMSQLFFYIFLGVTKFFLLGASPVTCCDLQAFALYIRHEQHNLSSAGAQFLGNWLPGHFPSSDFGSSPGFLWFKCHWPFHLWYFSILHLSFSDTHLLEMVVCWLDVVTLRIALLLVILSYSYIIKTIISFSFSSTAKKFIFTCSLHKIVVCISYCSCIFIY